MDPIIFSLESIHWVFSEMLLQIFLSFAESILVDVIQNSSNFGAIYSNRFSQ